MKYFKYCLILSFLLLFASQGNATTSKVTSSGWSVKAEPSVVDLAFSKEDIVHFINTYREKELKKLFGEDEELEEYEKERVGDFIWEDVDKDGYYELLVTTASSRAFFNSLGIYKSISGEKVLYQGIEVWMLDRFEGTLRDLNNDGYQELILPIRFTDYRGARPIAIWTAIYKWDGEKFQDASERFVDFYYEVLCPKVEERIRELEEEMRKFQPELDAIRKPLKDEPKSRYSRRVDLEMLEERLSAEWMIRDKISRLLGEDSFSGFERAKEWSQSPNVNLRKNSILVFSDIKDKESLQYLELLSLDSDSTVARRAKDALEKIKKRS